MTNKLGHHSLLLSLLLSLLFTQHTWAKNEETQILIKRIYDSETNANPTYKEEKIVFTKKDNMFVNEICLKKAAKPCEAFAKAKTKPTETNQKDGFLGHPASSRCLAYQGKNLIFFSPEGKEYDVCQFSDNSMVDSWDLYYKQNPKK